MSTALFGIEEARDLPIRYNLLWTRACPWYSANVPRETVTERSLSDRKIAEPIEVSPDLALPTFGSNMTNGDAKRAETESEYVRVPR